MQFTAISLELELGARRRGASNRVGACVTSTLVSPAGQLTLGNSGGTAADVYFANRGGFYPPTANSGSYVVFNATSQIYVVPAPSPAFSASAPWSFTVTGNGSPIAGVGIAITVDAFENLNGILTHSGSTGYGFADASNMNAYSPTPSSVQGSTVGLGHCCSDYTIAADPDGAALLYATGSLNIENQNSASFRLFSPDGALILLDGPTKTADLYGAASYTAIATGYALFDKPESPSGFNPSMILNWTGSPGYTGSYVVLSIN